MVFPNALLRTFKRVSALRYRGTICTQIDNQSFEPRMIIRITGTLEQTRTEPARAEVSVGEEVQWLIEVAGSTRSVRWEIYF
jgi:hypothetical protein